MARSLAGVELSLRLLRTILIAGGLAVLVVAALVASAWPRTCRALWPACGPPPSGSATSATSPTACRSTTTPHDELGRLSHSFNQMLAELEAANLGLKGPRSTPSAASWPTPPTSCAPR